MVPFLPLWDAPRMVDERVLAFEALKWLHLDPLAPFSVQAGGSGTWRPLLVYLYRLDAEASAAVAHGVNFGLAALAAGLVHAWLRRRLSPAGALLGACVFAVHPAHVASAGWIGGRADGAMVVCVLLALLAERRPWLAGLALVLAVGFKETAVAAVPMIAVLAWAGGRLRASAPTLALGLAAFALAWRRSAVDVGYLPSGDSLWTALRWAPPSLLEVVAPFFVPLGAPGVTRDVFGAAVAVLVVLALLRIAGHRSEVRLGLALAASGMLPVLHVLPNDGGQWYLLLPSVGAALVWGAAAEERRSLAVAVLVLASALALAESFAWREAAHRVDAAIEAQRSADPRVAPGPQDPRDWPHRGPSFCCGLPHQLYDDPIP